MIFIKNWVPIEFLVYARFDDSTKDFPTDTKFAQVGIIKNPSNNWSHGTIFTDNQFSSLLAMKLTVDDTNETGPGIGANEITQDNIW